MNTGYNDGSSILRIGDFISLRQPKPSDGFISAEGIINEDCFVCSNVDYFEDCLWEIHVQYQYSALRDLENFQLTYGKSLDENDDDEDAHVAYDSEGALRRQKEQEVLRKLRKAAVNEKRLNERLMRMKNGKPVAFGDVIQLRHVKSKTFLTVSMALLAKQERENMRVDLEPQGSAECCLSFVPKFKHDKEGQPISNNSEVFLRVQERPNEFIHAAKKSVKGLLDNRREINCSLEMTPWNVNVYQHSFDTGGKSVLAGQLVLIQEPETLACLTIDDHRPGVTRSANVVLSAPMQLSSSTFDTIVGTQLLWTVESVESMKGGPLQLRSDRILFRDLNTGLFMQLSDNGLRAVAERKKASSFELSYSQSSDVPILQEGIALQMCSGGKWVATGSASASSKSSTDLCKLCVGKSDRTHALSLVFASELFHTIGVDMHVGVNATVHLRKFATAAKKKTLTNDPLRPIEAEFKSLYKTLEGSYRFLAVDKQNDPGLEMEESHEIFQPTSLEIVKMRQTMLREQGLIDVLLDIIELCGGDSLDGIVLDTKQRNTVDGHHYNHLHQLHAHRKSILHSPGMIIAESRGTVMGGRNRKDSIFKGTVSPASSSNQNPRSTNVGNKFSNFLGINIGKDSATPTTPLSAAKYAALSPGSNEDRLVPASFHSQHEFLDEEAEGTDKFDIGGLGIHSKRESSADQSGGRARTIAQDVTQACLTTLLQAIRNNHTNQIFVADRFPLLLKRAKDQPVAVECVQEILRDNIEVLHTKVREREINMLVQLLVDSDMDVTFIKLIQSTCSMGFDTTQGFVTEALFGLGTEEEDDKAGGKSPAKVRTLSGDKTGMSSIEATVSGIVGFPQSPGDHHGFKDDTPITAHSTPKVSSARRVSHITKPLHGKTSFAMAATIISNTLAIRKKEEMAAVSNEPVPSIVQRTNLVLTLEAEREDLRYVDWLSEAGFYIPSHEEVLLKQMYGYGLLVDGVPKMYVKWPHGGTSGLFSMTHTFGVDKRVEIEALFKYGSRDIKESVNHMAVEEHVDEPHEMKTVTTGNMLKATPSARRLQGKAPSRLKTGGGSGLHLAFQNASKQNKQLLQRKVQISNYLVAQLYLVADLCLNRQYVAMGVLEEIYEYDMLLAILKNRALPNRVKAPVCRVIRCLFIDREPQVEAKFPRLIRTSVSLGGGEENSFSDHHSGSPYAFALLQQLISQYIHNDLNSRKCDALSAEMMDMLHALMMFGFYYTPQHLQDTVVPLIHALDHHRGIGSIVVDDKSSVSDEFEKQEIPEAAENDESLESIPLMNLSNKASASVAPAPVNFDSPLVSPKSEFEADEAELSEKIPQRDSTSAKKAVSERNGMKLWAIKWRKTTETVNYIGAIMVIVVVAVSAGLIQIFTKQSHSVVFALDLFDLCVAVIFIFELLLRILAHLILKIALLEFWKDIFNCLDTVVVLLDIVVLSLGVDATLADAASVVKILRIIRVIRLIRVLRAAKLMRTIQEVVIPPYTFPARYLHAAPNEVRTIVGILKILYIAMDRIQDKRLGICIKAFVEWVEEEKRANMMKTNGRSAQDVYRNVASSDTDLSADIPPTFDAVLTDIIMYNDPLLVQQALQLLMVYKSTDRLLCEAMYNVQIIYSPRVEFKCKEIVVMLRDLKRMGDMFEIWGKLETAEDKATGDEMEHNLQRMAELIVKTQDNKATVLSDLYMQFDEEVQQLLLNLDAMSTFMILQNSLYDGGNECSPMVKKLWRSVNDILCLFVNNCPANQEVVFKHISWFVARADDGVGCSKVIRATLKGNRELIKSLPRHYIGDFAKKIFSNGRKPEYLDLFVGAIEPCGNETISVKVIQNEIVKYLTSREWKDRLVMWCDISEAGARREAMLKCAAEHGADVEESDMSPDLQYHVSYLVLLANCGLGPKLQAMYPFEDVVAGIIDSATIFPVRKALGNLLLEMLRSDAAIQGIEISHLMWQFFEMVALLFEISESDLPKLFRSSGKPKPKIQRAEWLSICLQIVFYFFCEFDIEAFTDMLSRSNDFTVRVTSKTESGVMELIVRMFNAIMETRDKHGALFGEEIGVHFADALAVLSVYSPKLRFNSSQIADKLVQNSKTSQKLRRESVTIADIQQGVYREQFIDFAQKLTGNSQHLYSAAIELFEQMPLTSDKSESDVRLEPLLKKLTTHVRSMIKRNGIASRTLDHDVMDTAVWLIKTWRLMLEKYLGIEMENYCRSEGVKVYVNENATRFRNLFNSCGVTYLCLEIIAIGIDQALVIEAIYLLVAMLVGVGGNESVQVKIAKYLQETDSTLFFQELSELLEQLTLWSFREFEVRDDATKTSLMLPDEITVFKLLQLMGAGNFAVCQNIVREQSGNSRAVPLLNQIAAYSDTLSRLESLQVTQMLIHIVKTVHSLLQGPCKANQDFFVLQTELLLSLNRILRSNRPQRNCTQHWLNCLEQLKECCVDLLRVAIEDQREDSVILERVATAIELNVLHVSILPHDNPGDGHLGHNMHVEMDEDLTPLQANFLVFRHSLREKTKGSAFSISMNTLYADAISCVEVVWNNESQSHYFHIPDIVNDLTALTKEMLYDAMDSATHEMQLRSFLHLSRKLYIEATNQRTLRRIGIGNIAKWKVWLLRFMFLNAVAMNVILVAFSVKRDTGTEDDHHDDHTDDHSPTYAPSYAPDSHRRELAAAAGGCVTTSLSHNAENYMMPGPLQALMVLNSVQAVLAAATLAIYALIRIPTTYRSAMESGIGYFNALLKTACDPLPLWYLVYFICTLLGLFYDPLFLCALLLDFVVLDSITRDVLFAVTDPARQILSTVALVTIVVYIFSVVLFDMFWFDMTTFPETTLWETVKVGFAYGIRGEYGVSHEMTNTIGHRVILDVLFWVVVLEILRSVFHAIIIDGFGKLRELKMER